MKAKSDYIFLAVLGLLMAFTINNVVGTDILFKVTNYIAFAAWLIVFVAKLTKSRFGRYGVGAILILGTFNVCNFLTGTTWMSFGFGGTDLIQFNPVLFIILITWYFVNKKDIRSVYSKLFKDSTEEEAVKHQKMVDFYTDKFKDCSDVELERIYANFDSYPVEAQVALEKLKSA